MNHLAPPYPLIAEGLRKARVIPFLGSGASLTRSEPDEVWKKDVSGRLPSAAELSRHLANQTQFPPEEPLDLAKVAQYYRVAGGHETLREELHAIFDRDYPLSPIHTFLADLPKPLLIVTTNYDDLVERAIREKGRDYDLVIHTTEPTIGDRLLWWAYGKSEPAEVNPNKLYVDLQEVTVIYKMHGTVDRGDPRRDQYVITEDDYIDFLSRMTKNKAIPAIFAEPFQTRHFLFLGYGLRDWNLRVVLNRIEKDLRRPKGITYWAIQHKPSALERRFWQERGVELYDRPIDEFISELASH